MAREKAFTPENPSEERQYRHKLIEEFRALLEAKEYDLPKNSDHIVVLSAPALPEFKANPVGHEENSENEARIRIGVEIFQQIAADRAGKPIEDLTEEDYKNPSLPMFVLSGEPERLPSMEETALHMGIPKEKVYLSDCGALGICNTKTQFEEIAKDKNLSDAKQIAIVSSAYHIPRVARTASSELADGVDFDAIGVSMKDFPFDVYKKVRGEIKRIVHYSNKGDIKG